jgi:hypothetical protein
MKFLAGMILAFLLLLPLPAGAKTIDVGGAAITLPVLPGFTEIYGSNPQFDQAAQQFVPPTHVMLGIYISNADLKAMQANPQAGFKKYITVMTLQGTPAVNDATYEQLKAQLSAEAGGGDWSQEKDVSDGLGAASAYMQEKYAVETKMEVGVMKRLGTILNQPASYAILMQGNYGAQTEQGTIDVMMALAVGVMNVKGRAVYATAYSSFTGENDIDFVRDNFRLFAADLIAANAPKVKAVKPPVAAPLPPPAPVVTEEAPKEDIKEPAEEDKKKQVEVDTDDMMAWIMWVTVLMAAVVIAVLMAPKLYELLTKRDDRA